MATEWYFFVNGQVGGPVTAKGLRTMAETGHLSRADQVRQGDGGDWVPATRVAGLFEPSRGVPPLPPSSNGDRLTAARNIADVPIASSLKSIRSVRDCISREEKKKRFGVMLINLLIWLFLAILVVGTMGMILIIYAIGWAFSWLLSEYNVRKLQALGTTATGSQFPEVVRALDEVRSQFGVSETPKVIILNVSEMNAFAIKFARKKVIVLLSQTLEGVLAQPAELRFILAHELAHIVLDHGARGHLEIYKPASYKAAREMTCDNCGCAAAGHLESAKTSLKRLGVGNELYPRLNEEFLIAEARYIYSGLTGWILKQYLTYPPLGKRISNVTEFYASRA